MGEREQGRSRDAEAGRRGGPRERSSDSGFRSESGGSSRFSSGALPPMGSSGLPLSPSQGPLPGGGSQKAIGSWRRMASRHIKSMLQIETGCGVLMQRRRSGAQVLHAFALQLKGLLCGLQGSQGLRTQWVRNGCSSSMYQGSMSCQ